MGTESPSDAVPLIGAPEDEEIMSIPNICTFKPEHDDIHNEKPVDGEIMSMTAFLRGDDIITPFKPEPADIHNEKPVDGEIMSMTEFLKQGAEESKTPEQPKREIPDIDNGKP